MRKILLTFCITFTLLSSYAQINGTKNIPGNYSTLAEAITALNTEGVGTGGVTLNLLAGNPETAPAGGFVIGGAGSAVLTTSSSTQQIIIQGNGNTITASAAHTVGAINDAVFKLIGADWVTITGFTLVENSANTVTAAATNTMTEFGIALFYVTTTDGAQNNTISNNTIDLDRTYQNTFGIYSNSTHSSTAMTTVASATGAAGGNSGLTIIGNTITDVNLGIVVVGPTAAADYNEGLVIGGSLANGNNITNFGTTGTFSGYVNVSGTVNGILARNTRNFVVSYNSVVSSDGGTTAGTLNGIQVPTFSVAPTGTFTNSINNNSISLRSGIGSGAINGINVGGTSASVTSTININNNDFYNFGHTTGTASGAITFITQGGTHLNQSISNNTFTNNTVNTTGSVTFISNSHTLPAGGVKNVNGNSIVTGFSKTGGGGTITLFTDNGSDPSGTVNNTNNNNFSNITVTGATTINGILNTNGGSPTKSVSGNTLTNWTGGTSPITAMSINFDGGTTTVSGNTVSNITNGGAITGIALGSSGVGSTNASENIVHTLTGSATGAVNGISVAGGIRNLFRNKICNLENTNAGGLVNGLLVSAGTTVTAYNNIIGDLRAPNLNAANSLIGISVTGGTTVNLYYNTVYLNAVSEGALFGSSALSASTTPTLDLRNNIFVNLSSPNGATGYTSAYRRSSTTLTTYSANSNNNLFYAGTPGANNLIFFDGTNSDQTLAQFKTRVSPRDALSVSENPPFLSTSCGSADFLKINPAIATQIESGAVRITSPLAITTDYFGTIRAQETGYAGIGVSPDIGAHEGDFTLLDLVPPAITYTPLANTALTTARTLVVTVTDASGVPTTAPGWPHLYWKKTGDAGYTAVAPSNVSGSNYTYSFGAGTTLGDVVEYYVVAQDNASPPNVGAFPSAGAGGFTYDPPAAATPPATPSSYTIIPPPLAGDYTVGSGGSYETLTAAVSDLNLRGVSGATRFMLTDASYSASETFPIVIDITSEALPTSTNTVIIRPQASVTAVISGSSTSSILKLNGADYIIIDGSNTGGSDRNLTITNTNSGTSSAVVWIASKNASNGATNNTVKNCIVIGNAPTTTLGGVVTSSGTTMGGLAEAQNNFNTISNNEVKKSVYGIAAVGPTGNETGLVITNNLVGSTVTGDKIGLQGIAIFQQQDVNVSDNQVFGITRSASDNNAAGIFVSGTITGGSINGNKIWDIRNTSTGGWAASGVFLNSSTASTNLTLSNNVIHDVVGYGWASSVSDNGHGIRLANGGGYNLYYNSVNMATNQTVAANSAALYIASTGTGLNIVNNIFSNVQSTGTRYAIYTTGTAASFNSIDYNDYSSLGNVGFLTSVRATLSDWQTATGKDVGSISANPLFTSASNLQPLQGSPVLGAGTPIVSITLDIEGNARSATNPSMGAYEASLSAGSLTGVVNAAARGPIEGAKVTVGSLFDFTNAQGEYLIENVVQGSYTVICEAVGYITKEIPDVQIVNGETTVLNISLNFSTIEIDPQSFEVDLLPEGTTSELLTISNPGGTAPLNWSAQISYATRQASSYVVPEGYEFSKDYHLPVGGARSNPEITAEIATREILPATSSNVRASYSEEFDDITLLPGLGWAFINNSSPIGTTGWFQGNGIEVFPAHSGTQNSYIGANFNNTSDVGTISNWLITPANTMNNGDQIIFWSRAGSQTWPDRLQVRLSTNGNSTNVGASATSIGDFTTLLLEINPSLTTTGYPQVWTQYTITLSGLTGPTNGRIAFRYFVTDGGPNGTNSNYIGIDTYSYISSIPPLEWLSLSSFNGIVVPTESDAIDVLFDAAELTDGTYNANIVLTHNGQSVAGNPITIPVTLNVSSACQMPTNLTADNITPTSAELGWNDNAGALLWHVEVGAPGFTPGTGTALLSDYFTPNNPWLASPLTPATDYEFYVKAYCNGFDNPRIGNFWATIGEVGDLREGGGTFDPELQENGEWYLYEDAPGRPWWNIWWYNDPLDLTRMKKIRVGFWVTTFEPEQPGLLEYVVNWSTPAWVSPPLPLPGFPLPSQEMFIQRSPIMAPIMIAPGTPQWVELLYIVEEFNPEWVSLDIWGENFIIEMAPMAPPPDSPLHEYWEPTMLGGIIVHECLPKDHNTSSWSGPKAFSTPELCPAPSALDATGITANGANLSWTENGSATSWDIEFGATPYSFTGTPTITGVTNPYPLGGLSSNTEFTYKVRSVCGEVVSNWAGPKVFATLPTCPAPTGLYANNITTNSANIGWTPVGSETLWNIEWGETGFTLGLGTQIIGVVNNPYTLNGLESGTGYDFYVQADCGEDSRELSAWAGPYTFETVTLGQTCNAPIVISSVPFTDTDNTSNFGDDYSTADRPPLGGEQYTSGTGSGSYLDGDDVVYSITPETNGTYNFTLTNIGTWVGFWLFEGCDPFTSIVAYHTSSAGDTRSLPGIVLTGGNTYYIVISTWPTPQSTPYTLTVEKVVPPIPDNLTLTDPITGEDCFNANISVNINGATVESGASADIRSGGTITATNFEVKSGGTALLKAVTSITLNDNVLITPGAAGYFHASIGAFEPCVLPLAMVASEEVVVPEELPEITSRESFFKVFPNPTTGSFNLELTGETEETRIIVEVYNMMGDRMLQNELFGMMRYEFNLSELPRGVYLIRVLKGKQMGVERLIKQ